MGSPTFRILGPLEVDGAGRLGGPKQRALLVQLLLHANRAVSCERLIDELWAEDPPVTASHAVQVYVSRLRKALPACARIETLENAYRLEVDDDEVDALRFESLVARGRRLLRNGDGRGAAKMLREADVLWRGPAVEHLDELRIGAIEDRIDAELALGRHAELVAELEAVVSEHPLRERLLRQLMLALYRTGRQADALSLYRKTRRAFVDDLGIEPSAELRQLEAAMLRQDPELAVEPQGLRERRRLPAPTTPLVGRRAEVDEVSALLRGDARLVTLTGPGGTGKTRVALQAASELAVAFDDGAVFVGLGSLRDPGLVPAAIASALEVDDTAQLAERLGPLQLLLLLDNFEQVDAAAPKLATLLGAAPRLRLLVTSRHPLCLYGEHDFSVPPLAAADAVALFVARARAAGRRIDASKRVVELCERLDRLPLAIELVAARLRELDLEEMLSTLRRLDLAAGGPRDVPERQRTLRATIAWSVDLLDDAERRAFARLGVFSSMFDAPAASAICDAEGALLESLARKSLLGAIDGGYVMLETVREYARELLIAGGGEHATQARHAQYLLELAERADRQLALARSQAEWLALLERVHDDLRAAIEWAGTNDQELELRLALALGRFWEWRGHVREGARRLEAALERHPDRADVPFGRALLRASVLTHVYGDRARSAELAEAGAAVARTTRDAELIANALRRLGTLAKDDGDLVLARQLHEEALGLSRDAEDARGLSSSLMNLADIALLDGRNEDARRLSEESVALARELGDGMREVISLLNLALAALNDGGTELAARTFAEAARMAAALGYRDGVAFALDGVGGSVVGRDPVAAARLLGAAESLLEGTGMVLEPAELALHERTVEALRARLAPRVVEEEWARGRELDIEASVGAATAAASTGRRRSG